jgi:hypothetical protein
MYHLLLNPSNNFKRERCAKVQEFFVDKNNNGGVVEEWALKGGGVLSFYAPVTVRDKTITYEIKLHTVLSAYEPHQTLIPEIENNRVEMNWKHLEAVMQSRYPDRVYVDIQNAVKQYFLELKKDKNDYQCRFYSPSVPIKEVWFAHLSFLDRYQHDIQALTGVKSKIFENIPITKDKSISRYNDTRQTHVKRMAALSELVDTKFWSKDGGRSSPSTSRASANNDNNRLTKGRWSIFPYEKNRWTDLWLYLDKTLGWSYNNLTSDLKRGSVSTIWFRPGFNIKDRGKLGTDYFLNEDDVLAYCDANNIRPPPPSPAEEDEREEASPLSRDEEMEDMKMEAEIKVHRYLTGTKIRKQFEDGDWYNGKIKLYNKKREYFIIKYEDGETEEFDEDDVKQWLKYAVGTRIKKKVWDGNWYNGEIKSYNRKRGYYLIKYEDGESEEFDEDDVEQWLVEEEKEEEEDDDDNEEEETEDRYNFPIIWKRLKKKGWDFAKPTNRFDGSWYARPASIRPRSERIKGVDYFCTQQEVITFCKSFDSASIWDTKNGNATSKNMTKNNKNNSSLPTKKSGKKKKPPLFNNDHSDGKHSTKSNRPKRYKKKGRIDADVDGENNDEPSNKNRKLSYLCNDENLKINNDGNDITPWKINAPLCERKLCLAVTDMRYLYPYYYLPGEKFKKFNESSKRFTSVEEIAQHFARTNNYTLLSSGSKLPTNDAERSFVRLIRYALVPGTLWMWKEIRKINRSETCYLLGTIGYRRMDSGGWKTPDALVDVLEFQYNSLDLLCEALSCLEYLNVPPNASRRRKLEINLSHTQHMALRLRIAEGFTDTDDESEEEQISMVNNNDTSKEIEDDKRSKDVEGSTNCVEPHKDQG